MVDMNAWLEQYVQAMQNTFRERICFNSIMTQRRFMEAWISYWKKWIWMPLTGRSGRGPVIFIMAASTICFMKKTKRS